MDRQSLEGLPVNKPDDKKKICMSDSNVSAAAEERENRAIQPNK